MFIENNNDISIVRSILFIDIENCPSKIDELIEDFKVFQKIVICYAKTGVKIPLEWLLVLNDCVTNDRLELVKMSEIANNSADFGITFLLGRYFEHYDHFTVYSDDKDFDVVIELIGRTEGKSAERFGKISTMESAETIDLDDHVVMVSVPIKLEPTFENVKLLVKNYLEKTPDRSRPVKRQGLFNSICSRLNKLDCEDEVKKDLSNQIIYHLEKIKAISFNNEKIKYNGIQLLKFMQ